MSKERGERSEPSDRDRPPSAGRRPDESGRSPDWIEGGCHCGLIAFRARGRPDKVVVCNCTICAMKGYLHWIIPQADFVLERGQDRLATYRFNTLQARHHFCPVCGVAPFYIARSDPDKVDVNARCLRDLDLAGLAIETFDGQHWEAAYERYRDPRA